MKILCFGDSFTWATKKFGIRYSSDIRWTKQLNNILGEDYTIIEDGLCGREAGILQEECTSTKGFLYKSIMKYYPFDVLILMLGITDMRLALHLSAEDIASSVGELAKAIMNYNYEIGSAPKIIIAAPPHIKSGVATKEDAHIYGLREDAVEKSKQLSPLYKKVADELGLQFFSTAKYITDSEISDFDAIHLNEKGHQKFAQSMADFIKNTKF